MNDEASEKINFEVGGVKKTSKIPVTLCQRPRIFKNVPKKDFKISAMIIWDKVFKNGQVKFVEGSFKDLNCYGLLRQALSLQIF